MLFQTDTTIWAVAHGDTVDGPYLACAGVDQTVNVIDPTGAPRRRWRCAGTPARCGRSPPGATATGRT